MSLLCFFQVWRKSFKTTCSKIPHGKIVWDGYEIGTIHVFLKTTELKVTTVAAKKTNIENYFQESRAIGSTAGQIFVPCFGQASM
jgi:hypothetical protein